MAKNLLGKVRLTGYDAAAVDAQVLGVRADEMRPAMLWVLAIVLVEQISASCREEEVEHYDADESFDEVLTAMGRVDAASLLKVGGAK